MNTPMRERRIWAHQCLGRPLRKEAPRPTGTSPNPPLAGDHRRSAAGNALAHVSRHYYLDETQEGTATSTGNHERHAAAMRTRPRSSHSQRALIQRHGTKLQVAYRYGSGGPGTDRLREPSARKAIMIPPGTNLAAYELDAPNTPTAHARPLRRSALKNGCQV